MVDKLSNFATRAGILASHRKLPDAPRAVALPEEDDVDIDAHDKGRLGHAEGQSFMIEYVDSSGRVSRRRVTVFDIKVGADGVAMLHARCHERKAQRAFRVDRIRSCIDYDGEVHDDVPAFMQETFGMASGAFGRVARADVEAAPRASRLGRPVGSKGKGGTHHSWNALRACVRPRAILFAALSRSDGTMRDEEVEIAIGHCTEYAQGRGHDVTGKDRSTMTAYLRRQAPGVDVIRDALQSLVGDEPHEVTDFLIAALALMDVDGNRDPEEIELVNELSEALTGMKMA
jgi:hypothetical protein